LLRDERESIIQSGEHPPVVDRCIMEEVMKVRYLVGMALLAGVGIGAAAVQTLHAQATAPIYRIAEIEITNVDAYTKDFAPKAQAALKGAGGKFLAAGQKVTGLEGDPPKTRVTIQVWDSMEKMKAAYEAADYKEARKIGDKYAKFRAFAVEGLPQ
jgi:uncharacterized protein (DUF1330 family)